MQAFMIIINKISCLKKIILSLFYLYLILIKIFKVILKIYNL